MYGIPLNSNRADFEAFEQRVELAAQAERREAIERREERRALRNIAQDRAAQRRFIAGLEAQVASKAADQ